MLQIPRHQVQGQARGLHYLAEPPAGQALSFRVRGPRQLCRAHSTRTQRKRQLLHSSIIGRYRALKALSSNGGIEICNFLPQPRSRILFLVLSLHCQPADICAYSARDCIRSIAYNAKTAGLQISMFDIGSSQL